MDIYINSTDCKLQLQRPSHHAFRPTHSYVGMVRMRIFMKQTQYNIAYVLYATYHIRISDRTRQGKNM
jgi:hypothetical protein